MSVRAQTWAWDQDVPMSTKGVLLALADHADNDGTCWPGVKSVAEKCRMSQSTVRYHLRILRKAKLITAEERKREDGSSTSNIYHLPVNILTPSLQSLIPTPITDAEPASEPLIPKNPQGTIREPSVFIETLRGIEGWDKKGEPHLERMMAWIESKNITEAQLEASAIGLAKVQEKTLKGYSNLYAAFQDRISKGYDDPEKVRSLNGKGNKQPLHFDNSAETYRKAGETDN